MTSDITLELDHDGVRLVKDDGMGAIRRGSLRLDDPDFDTKLRALREELGAGGATDVEIMLPSALVVFFDTDDVDDEELAEQVQEATGCAPEDLLIERSGAAAAVVERTTLDEARAFAKAHGFVPRAFVARDLDAGRPPAVFQPEPPRSMAFRTARMSEEAPEAASAPIPDAPKPPAAKAPASVLPAPATREADASADEPPSQVAPETAERGAGGLAMAPLYVAAAIVTLALVAGTLWIMAGGAGGPVARTGQEPAAGGDVAVIATEPAETSEPADTEAPGSTEIAREAPASRPDQPAAPADADAAVGPSLPALPPEVPPPGSESLPAMPAPPRTAMLAPPEATVPPPPPGSLFEMDERGLVRATADGAVTPRGVVVYAGLPSLSPPPEALGATSAPAAGAAERDPVSEPPEAVAEPPPPDPGTGPDAEVAADAIRPRPRPSTEPDPAAEGATDAAPSEPLAPATAPEAPTDFDSLAEQARSQTAGAAAGLATTRAAAPPPPEPTGERNVAVQPSLPTRTSVADRATLDNAIRLEQVNLIGVYGTPADRRALVRLPTGRYVKVKVGDRVDGGRVAEISAGQLDYVKNGRRLTLRMPRG